MIMTDDFKMSGVKSSTRHKSQVLECWLLSTIFAGVMTWFVLGLVVEIAIALLILIPGVIFLFKKPMFGRWWSFVLVALGIVSLVVTFVIPSWVFLVAFIPNILVPVIIGWVIFFALIMYTEKRRSKTEKPPSNVDKT
jgi:hypothetical protein